MNVVHEDVEKLVDKELEAATERFGLHHSWHEKYAVTLEEVQECVEEAERMRSFLENVFDQIKENKPDNAKYLIQFVKDHAARCAIEAIQVAAMCKKEIDESVDKGTAEISDHGTYTGKDEVRVLHCVGCGDDFVATIRPYPNFCPKCGKKFSNVLIF